MIFRGICVTARTSFSSLYFVKAQYTRTISDVSYGQKVSVQSYSPIFTMNITRGQQYVGHWVCEGFFTLEGSSVVVWGVEGSQSVSGVRQRFLPTWDCGPANNRSLNKPVPGLSTFDRNQSVSAVIWHEMNISPVIWSLCHLEIA